MWTRAANRVAGRAGSRGLILVGGALLAAGDLSQSFPGIALAAIFIGGGFAFMHPTLQSWATGVAPEARASVISFCVAALFVGGLATAAAAPLAEASSYPLIFDRGTYRSPSRPPGQPRPPTLRQKINYASTR